ncbi:MAG: hypothetical protein ACOCVV_02920 [Marinobacter sp.]
MWKETKARDEIGELVSAFIGTNLRTRRLIAGLQTEAGGGAPY